MRTRHWLLLGLTAAASLCASCATQPPVWSYQGATGPAAWSRLDPSYSLCNTGRSQSPVNLVEVTVRDAPKLQFRYGSTPVRLTNTGRAIEQSVQGVHTLSLGKASFALSHIKFHAPSEHRAAGRIFAMEMQWMHKSPQGHIAAVAVMVKAGRANPNLAPLLAHLPQTVGETLERDVAVPLQRLLPRQSAYVRYSGSLTEPPCWENVMWMILTEPIEASPAQIAELKKLYPNNARPVMPVGRRSIFLSP